MREARASGGHTCPAVTLKMSQNESSGGGTEASSLGRISSLGLASLTFGCNPCAAQLAKVAGASDTLGGRPECPCSQCKASPVGGGQDPQVWPLPVSDLPVVS